ncbi:SLC13 family permease [Luteolibacter pohnpeiensis]|uniref:SLC13 family permease n=1 Tax=Luteolibacter pohnpeiensis TaxID=454153 RepID=A0A934S8D3_9BACT|nr:SLC13 family permease [Luteolibacter pohnpeiensis]MBK1884042.1 SLC13 family permease [Luteolibacter pohnpeiensis]
MNSQQCIILGILIATVAMFIWGKWRHDMIALAALLGCVVTGLVPADGAFAGFGHPAVVTVACVLVMSRALQMTGAVDLMTRRLLPSKGGALAAIGILCGLAAFLSAFMNNVGALAMLMPVGLQMAKRHDLPPGKILMPLSFASILGGMTTLIGTPPNLIVSGFRAQTKMGSFTMFDFAAVGIPVALAGLALVVFGRKLVPIRQISGVEGFATGSYMTEGRVEEGSKMVGKTLREVDQQLEDFDAQVVGMVRNRFRVVAPNRSRVLMPGDILVIESDPESLASALSGLGLQLVEAKDAPDESANPSDSESETEDPNTEATAEKPPTDTSEMALMELAVRPDAEIIGRSATDIRLRSRYGINFLALSRQGSRSIRRLRSLKIHAGDVMLMQGPQESVIAFAAEFGCVPLAPRSIRLPDKRSAWLAIAFMAAAVCGAAFGLLPASISFATGVLLCMAFRVVSLRSVYEAIDWPVIVLLGALIPVAGAMETTGAAERVASGLLNWVAQGNAVVGLAVVLIVTMTLSDFMNNAATAAVMCPIALSTAAQLGARPDSFLMAVAIGASCAFLTPIGHQNNTLILGPGGFRFGDYWKLGLPLEIVVVAVALPMLLWVWPL